MPFDSKFFLSEVELIESNDLSNDEKLASIIELTKICFKPDTNKKRKLNNSFHRNKSFLQHLCIRTFNLVNQTDTYQSYKQTFATQLNVKNGHYFFSGITEDTNIIKNPMRNFIDYNQSRKTITQNDFSNKGSKVVFAWPCHSSDSYHLALDSNKIYWVVDSKNSAINVTCIDDLINFNVEIDKPIRACSFSTNHTSPIALVMSNNEGTLISLDTNSVIKIWDLKENNCERTLNENREHGFIMSVDIYKRKLVTGSETGKILLWDLDSGDVIISLEIPDEYIAHLQVEDRFLNVAIWEDTLVYGLFDGSYHVFDLNLGRIIYIFSTVNGLSVTRFNGDEGKAIFLENHPDILNSFGNTDELIQSAGLNLGRRRSSNPSEIFSNYSQVDQLLQQLPQIPLLQQLPQIEPILQQLPQIETRRTPQQDHLFQHPPKTLTLNGHILITNGPEADEIAVWDLIHGEALYVLSERFSLRKFNFNIPAFRNVHYAEISKDCSTIFTSVNFEQCNSLLCWAVLNYRLKSTEGWSIGNIMLDFTGGIFSLFQLLLDSYIANNWSGILGNVVKLGLGLISISFDLLFFFQHCTYRNSTKLEESLNNEDNAGLISSHNNCNLRRSLSTLTEETPLLETSSIAFEDFSSRVTYVDAIKTTVFSSVDSSTIERVLPQPTLTSGSHDTCIDSKHIVDQLVTLNPSLKENLWNDTFKIEIILPPSIKQIYFNQLDDIGTHTNTIFTLSKTLKNCSLTTDQFNSLLEFSDGKYHLESAGTVCFNLLEL
ncbi:hypothetical protein HDU92_001612 [Lobulomyces angularis]|nr:hypothetical protein HDU92_001612 [Lobulomyces angularis]